MANSLILYKNKSLWIGDSTLEIIIYYLVPFYKQYIENESNTTSDKEWFQNYYEQLTYYLQGFFSGGIDFNLKEITEDSFRLDFFKNNMQIVKSILEEKGHELSVKELNMMEEIKPGEKIYWENPVSTESLIETIDSLLHLLNE